MSSVCAVQADTERLSKTAAIAPAPGSAYDWWAIAKLGLIAGAFFAMHSILSAHTHPHHKAKANPTKQSPQKNANANANANAIVTKLTEEQWKEFRQKGFVKIGKTLTDAELNQLRRRIHAIMAGDVKYEHHLMMQLDPNANESVADYFAADIANTGQTVGFKKRTLNYRKIGEAGCGLECDPLFTAFMRKPVFEDIARCIYGKHASIAAYRAMVFNKPVADNRNNNKNKNSESDNKSSGDGDGDGYNNSGGSYLPWHQDGGNWWALDRDPLLFCWTALYPATKESGCVQAIAGSYKEGVLSREGHMLTENEVAKYCTDTTGKWNIVNLECDSGETFLVHNWTIHCSGTNQQRQYPRIAFSCNYIDGRTRVLDPKPIDSGKLGKPGQSFFEVFPAPF